MMTSRAAASTTETVPGADPAVASGAESLVQFSGHTQDKATKAKVHLEGYYSNLLTQFQVNFRRSNFGYLYMEFARCPVHFLNN